MLLQAAGWKQGGSFAVDKFFFTVPFISSGKATIISCQCSLLNRKEYHFLKMNKLNSFRSVNEMNFHNTAARSTFVAVMPITFL